MEKLLNRREATQILGISLATLDTIRKKGQIEFIQHGPNSKVFFTEGGLQEYLAKSTHRVKPERQAGETYRRPHNRKC